MSWLMNFNQVNDMKAMNGLLTKVGSFEHLQMNLIAGPPVMGKSLLSGPPCTTVLGPPC